MSENKELEAGASTPIGINQDGNKYNILYIF